MNQLKYNVKFYLSSYRLGDQADKFACLMPVGNKRIAIIPNAKDYEDDPEKRTEREARELVALKELGVEPEIFDLREFFGWQDLLKKKMSEFGGVWVMGGNTFVLRQAMWLSGFDLVIKEIKKNNVDFLYAGYSAGCCVLAPTLKGLDIVDDPTARAYGEYPTMWEGIGLIDFSIAPHYQSDHPESAGVDKEVEYMIANEIPYKTLRDGEVIII